MRRTPHNMSAMIDKLSDPAVLFAFIHGYNVRDSGHYALSPGPMTKEETAMPGLKDAKEAIEARMASYKMTCP